MAVLTVVTTFVFGVLNRVVSYKMKAAEGVQMAATIHFVQFSD